MVKPTWWLTQRLNLVLQIGAGVMLWYKMLLQVVNTEVKFSIADQGFCNAVVQNSTSGG